jgi:hypothetical protein
MGELRPPSWGRRGEPRGPGDPRVVIAAVAFRSATRDYLGLAGQHNLELHVAGGRRVAHQRGSSCTTQTGSCRPGWVYEEKMEGWRVLAYKDAAGVHPVSRNARALSQPASFIHNAPRWTWRTRPEFRSTGTRSGASRSEGPTPSRKAARRTMAGRASPGPVAQDRRG